MTDAPFYGPFPLLLMLGFYAIAMGWRSYIYARRYGASGVALGSPGDTLLHRSMIAVSLAHAVQACVAAGRPELLSPLLLAPSSVSGVPLGIGLLAGGLLLLMTAQQQMGQSWRLGIDRSSRTELVTHGLYRHVRHPIAAGLMMASIGFVCLIPTVASLVLTAVSLTGLYIEVRKEERHMQHLHGAAYEAYARQTARFFPRMRAVTSKYDS